MFTLVSIYRSAKSFLELNVDFFGKQSFYFYIFNKMNSIQFLFDRKISIEWFKRENFFKIENINVRNVKRIFKILT